MIDRVAFLAPTSPPVTGRSSVYAPTFKNSLLIFSARVGEEVVISTNTWPFLAVVISPFSPR